MWKQILLVILVVAGCASAFQGTMGKRGANDRLLFAITRSTMPTAAAGKHELTIAERDINASYIEYNFNTQPSDIRIREFGTKNINIIFTSESTTQLSGEIRVFGRPN